MVGSKESVIFCKPRCLFAVWPAYLSLFVFFWIQNSHLPMVGKKGKEICQPGWLVERQTLKSVDFLRCSFSLAPATIFHPRQESSFDFARKCFTISKVFHQSPEYSNMFHKSSRVFFMATHNFIWISARYLCWIVPQNIEYPKRNQWLWVFTILLLFDLAYFGSLKAPSFFMNSWREWLAQK